MDEEMQGTLVIDLNDGSMEALLPPAEIQAAIAKLIATWPQDYFHRNPKFAVDFCVSFAFMGDPGDELPGFTLETSYDILLASAPSFVRNAATVERTRNLIKVVREHLPATLRVGRYEVVFFPDRLENQYMQTVLQFGLREVIRVVK